MVTFYPKQAGGGFVTYLKLSLIRFDNQFENFCISISFSFLIYLRKLLNVNDCTAYMLIGRFRFY